MAKCAYCGTIIVFGGKKDGGLRYCNSGCWQKGAPVRLRRQVEEWLPDDAVQEHAAAVHQGKCPRCHGPGPVDVHVSHRVWSAIKVTRWSSRSRVCCRACGAKAKLGDAVFSFFLGWWGFPFGPIMTPLQVLRNLAGLLSRPDPSRPSTALLCLARESLARDFLREQQAGKRILPHAGPAGLPPDAPAGVD
ncbi:MAG: hypothetical protein ABSG86_10725 [Thermoguttaceae bacterium]|jgi:hypothetical protein